MREPKECDDEQLNEENDLPEGILNGIETDTDDYEQKLSIAEPDEDEDTKELNFQDN